MALERRNKYVRWVKSIIVVLASAFVLTLFLVQVPGVQSVLVRRVLRSMSKEMQCEIKVGHVHIFPLRTIILKDVLLLDKNPHAECSDTIGYIHNITAVLSARGFLNLGQKPGECEIGPGKAMINLERVSITGGQFNLVIEEGKVCNIQRAFGITEPKDVPIKDDPTPNLFYINKVRLRDYAYTMKNYRSPKASRSGAVNYSDLSVKDIEIDIENVGMCNTIVRGKVSRMTAYEEKAGYKFVQMSADSVRVGRGLTKVDNIHLIDAYSNVFIDCYQMSSRNRYSWQNFINEIVLDGVFNGTEIDMRTISILSSGGFCKKSIPLVLDGHARGTVNNIRWNVKVTVPTAGTRLAFDGGVKNITTFDKANFDSDVKVTGLTTKGLSHLLQKPSLAKIAPGLTLNPRIQVSGGVDSLTLYLTSKDNGFLGLHLEGTDVLKQDRWLSVRAQTRDFDFGKVVAPGKLGKATLDLRAEARTPSEGLAVKLKDLNVKNIEALGYDYNSITASGSFEEQSLNLILSVCDPNLEMDFNGSIGKGHSRIPDYDFIFNLQKCNLTALGFHKKGMLALSTHVTAHKMYSLRTSYKGTIDVDKTILADEAGAYAIDKIKILSSATDSSYSCNVSSSALDVDFVGEGDPLDCGLYLVNKVMARHVPALLSKAQSEMPSQKYNLSVNFKDYTDAFTYIVNGLYIDKGTKLSLVADASGDVNIGLTSGRIAFKDNYFKDLALDFVSNADSLKADFRGNNLVALKFGVERPEITLSAHGNKVHADLGYCNADSLVRASVCMSALFARSKKGDLDFTLDINDSNINTSLDSWKISKSQITRRNRALATDLFKVTSRDQTFVLSGSTADTLRADFKAVDLKSLSLIIPKVAFEGVLNGALKADFRYQNYGGALKIDRFTLNKELIGDMDIKARYNTVRDIVTVALGGTNDKGEIPIDLNFNADVRNGVIEGNAFFDNFNLATLYPFLDNVFTKLEGTISGGVTADVVKKQLNLHPDSHLKLSNVDFAVDFTGVEYLVDGMILPKGKDQLIFDNIAVRDTKGGSGVLTGGIDCSNFKKLTVDAQLKVNDIEAIDIKNPTSGFGGNIFASGTVGVRGPLNELTLWLDASVSKPSTLVIPLWKTSSANASKILSFLTAQELLIGDGYERMMYRLRKEEKKTSGKLAMKMKVAADENLTARIELGEYDESALQASGRGSIELQSDPIKGFGIVGDYLINEGKFHFNAVNLVTRDFAIDNGSSIKFNGPIMNSVLDARAIYRTKASISTLISDTTSTSNRKNVDCIIKIGGALTSPAIDFDIVIPDLEPMARSRVENALITKDKVQRQFFSLLISNNFLPSEESGIINNSTVVYSNVSEIMANQVSKILHKLDIPLDLGLNYQPQKNGKDVFDVAVSTQLFNNRLEIGGSISNGNKIGSGISGDIDVEYKINKPGTIRAKAFSHSPNEYNYFSDNSQRNGVGVSVQKEFTTFKELGEDIKKAFTRKKKADSRTSRKVRKTRKKNLQK